MAKHDYTAASFSAGPQFKFLAVPAVSRPPSICFDLHFWK